MTFLIEATWSSGRLLREYTVLLDPPTYAPPAVQQAPAVTAPLQSAPADTGRIERQQPVAEPAPQRPRQAPAPRPAPADTSYATGAGRDYVVQRGETLWGIANRMRPDGRLTMNQTMVAIYEANPDAFGGNINLLRAGAYLRIPSADEVFRISRGSAFGEVKRQNEAWDGGSVAPSPAPAPAPAAETRPSLTLVPPDEEPDGVVYDDELVQDESLTREQELENRIRALESADVPDQQSLIQIRDNELAALRQELANIRGETYEAPAEVADETIAEEEPIAGDLSEDAPVDAIPDDIEAPATDEIADETVAEEAAPSTVVRTPRVSRPGIGERILDALTSAWAGIAAALLVAGGLVFWFMRRRGDDDADGIGPWEGLDSDEAAAETFATTETISPPTPDQAIEVVEQDTAIHAPSGDTAEVPAVEIEVPAESGQEETAFGSLEDTFSSDTALNLDQTDPLAEADFHMAYGLYDQAADLVQGALASEPEDTGLLSKLCEIYFVWGNRDAFVEAAGNLKSVVGENHSEWDKIVIMGQQIAADHEMFAGAGVGAATQAVDLTFDVDAGDDAALDVDFGGPENTMTSGAIDLTSEESVDFDFGDSDELDIDITAETPAIDEGAANTVEIPSQGLADDSPTIESTIEDEIGEFDGTSELPALDATLDEAIADVGQSADATAEINLDDLDLGLDDIEDAELGSLDDDLGSALTGAANAEDAAADVESDTGKNPRVDPTRTGVHESLGLEELLEDDDATGEMRLAADETGRNPLLDTTENEALQAGVDIDPGLLDATGASSALGEEQPSSPISTDDSKTDLDSLLSDEAATMLASMDSDIDEAQVGKTQALPAEVFDDGNIDETGEMPAVPGSTDVDLDLEDLTAALKVTEIGDTYAKPVDEPTMEQPLGDATVEQPLGDATVEQPLGGDATVEQPLGDATVEQPLAMETDGTAEVETMSLGPEEVGDDLHDARTMTEVGTKLDLARAYVDMGDPSGARSILEEVIDEGDEGQRQQAKQLLETLPG